MKKGDIVSALVLLPDYGEWLASLKQRIRSARQRAVMAMNEEQIRLYHSIGCDIIERQSQQGWGAKVIKSLSADLREAFPEMKGLSVSNLKYAFLLKNVLILKLVSNLLTNCPGFTLSYF